MARRLISSQSFDSNGVYYSRVMLGSWITSPLIRMYVDEGSAPSGAFDVSAFVERSTDYDPVTEEGTWIEINSALRLDQDSRATLLTTVDPPSDWYLRGKVVYSTEYDRIRIVAEIWGDKDNFENAINVPSGNRVPDEYTDANLDLFQPKMVPGVTVYPQGGGEAPQGGGKGKK